MGQWPVTRIGRYWIFFVIVAVGLALSWGQVGNKTQRVLLEEPITYLRAEADCRPRVEPCAALGSDRALVLGPADTGLIARKTGMDGNDVNSAEVIMLAADGTEVGRLALLPGEADWRLADIPAATRAVRFRLTGRDVTTVAEFPLGQF